MGIPQIRNSKAKCLNNPNANIALVGGGPASLSCATYLGRLGYENITIYEKQQVLGGLRYVLINILLHLEFLFDILNSTFLICIICEIKNDRSI